MRVLDSSIARLMFASLTVAMGFHVMTRQSEFWLGVFAATAGAWLLLGVGEATRRGGRGRPFWVTFTAVVAASLAWSFGPWSDAEVRWGWGNPKSFGQKEYQE